MSTDADINVSLATDTLQPNERLFRALIESSSDVIVLLNTAGVVTYVSPSITRVMGYDPIELIGSHALALIHTDDLPAMQELFASIMQSPGKSLSGEYRMRCQDGTWGWFEGTGTNLLYDPGVQAIVGNFRDISERKRTEEALQLSHQRFELAVQASEAGLWYCDLPFDKLIWNEKVKEHFGLPADAEVDIDLFYELLHPDDRERTRQAIEQSIANHSTYDIEYRTISPTDGRMRWIHASGRAFYNLDGTPRRFDGLTLDVTERKQMEAKLRESEERYRLIVENAQDLISIYDMNGCYIYVSPSVKRLLGYEPEELLGLSALAPIHPDDVAGAAEELQKLLTGDYVFLPGFRVRHKNGDWRIIESSGKAILDEQGNPYMILAVSRDITEHQQAQEQLLFHASIARSISDAVIATDTSFHILSWNEAAETLYGWKEEEVLGRDILDFFHIQHLSGVSREAWQAEVATKGFWKGEVIQYHRNGMPIYALVSVSTVRDEAGNVPGFVAVSRDFTERKLAEQRKDEFLSMVSHELKTPVTSIKGFTQLLLRRFQQRDDEQSLQFLTRMDGQLTKLAKLINDLLDISRMQTGQMIYRQERFDLDAHVREVVENVQATTQSHRLLIEGETGAQVYADKDRIGQVLINLLTNAIKYSPEADRVIIRLERQQDEVVVSVRDFGIGIAELHQEKIFERFYQVADGDMRTFPGLGIGLYIAMEIIKRHQGRIWVESKTDEGATFSFALPVSRAANPER